VRARGQMLNKKFTYAWCLVHLKTREDINSGISLLTVCAPRPPSHSLVPSFLPPSVCACVRGCTCPAAATTLAVLATLTVVVTPPRLGRS
jgi:hypothetical protein